MVVREEFRVRNSRELQELGKNRLTEKVLRITISPEPNPVWRSHGMRACFLRKILSGIVLVILPAALFAADSDLAMLYSNGVTRLNGYNLPRSSAIFSGDVVQTAEGSVAKINASGSSLLVLSDSRIQFEGNAVKLEQGSVTVSTSKLMATHAGDVAVIPSASVWTQFDVADVDGRVRIAARKGDLIINDRAGATMLAQGQETTREASPQTPQDESEKHKKKRKRGAGAPAAAGSTIMDSPVAIGAGAAAVVGLTTWVLLQDGEPVSPKQ